MYQDITLTCRDCGNEFIFSAGEQEFFAEKGLQNRPQRCKACRDARKAALAEGGASGKREFFIATCARCGGEAKLPFQPSNDRPVYCSSCFAEIRQQGKSAAPVEAQPDAVDAADAADASEEAEAPAEE